jgi:hypothetical protein
VPNNQAWYPFCLIVALRLLVQKVLRKDTKPFFLQSGTILLEQKKSWQALNPSCPIPLARAPDAKEILTRARESLTKAQCQSIWGFLPRHLKPNNFHIKPKKFHLKPEKFQLRNNAKASGVCCQGI